VNPQQNLPEKSVVRTTTLIEVWRKSNPSFRLRFAKRGEKVDIEEGAATGMVLLKSRRIIYKLCVGVIFMPVSFEEIRDAGLHLCKEDKVRILTLVALDAADTRPGIQPAEGVCGGSARILRTRIPV